MILWKKGKTQICGKFLEETAQLRNFLKAGEKEHTQKVP